MWETNTFDASFHARLNVALRVISGQNSVNRPFPPLQIVTNSVTRWPDSGSGPATSRRSLADPHAGDRRKGVRHLLDDPGVARRVRMDFGQGRDMAVRRALEGVGRKHQHEINAEALPVDVAQIADPGRNVAAEHVDHDLVAYFELQAVGDLLFHRDQRRAAIVRAPPFALDDL